MPGFRVGAIAGFWWLQLAEIGNNRLGAEHDAMVDRRAAADVAVPAKNRVSNDRVLADSRVRPDDRVLHVGVLLDVALLADDAVRADPCAGLDHGSLVDEAGAL